MLNRDIFSLYHLVQTLLNGGRIILTTESAADMKALQNSLEGTRPVVAFCSPNGFEIATEVCKTDAQIVHELTVIEGEPLSVMKTWRPEDFDSRSFHERTTSRAQAMTRRIEMLTSEHESTRPNVVICSHPVLLTIMARQLARQMVVAETRSAEIAAFQDSDILIFRAQGAKLVIERPRSTTSVAA
jgi:broad specificity phosphatase PhoE